MKGSGGRPAQHGPCRRDAVGCAVGVVCSWDASISTPHAVVVLQGREGSKAQERAGPVSCHAVCEGRLLLIGTQSVQWLLWHVKMDQL